MKRRVMERNGIPVTWTRGLFILGALYAACVLTMVVPAWSVVGWVNR